MQNSLENRRYYIAYILSLFQENNRILLLVNNYYKTTVLLGVELQDVGYVNTSGKYVNYLLFIDLAALNEKQLLFAWCLNHSKKVF